MEYDIKPIHGHFEVYVNGKFYCTTDTMAEAMEEIEKAFDNTKLMV